jgi:hypothetical protein
MIRRIAEPYYFSFKFHDLESTEIAKSLSAIRSQIRKHYQLDGSLPKTFSSGGIYVTAESKTQDHGRFASSQLGYRFGGEASKTVKTHLKSASAQLPPDSCGIIVIDRTLSTWIELDDMLDACFGSEHLFGRASGGFFRRDSGTRVAAGNGGEKLTP